MRSAESTLQFAQAHKAAKCERSGETDENQQVDAVASSIISEQMARGILADVLSPSQNTITDDWVSRITATLSNRQASFERAETLRAALQPVMTWSNAATELLTAISDQIP